MEIAEIGISRTTCVKMSTHTLHTSLLWLISCACMKYSKCGLELPNSSSRRIDSQSRSSAGVNQHNPIKTKRTTLIYSTKRSGLEAFKNSIWKINSSKPKPIGKTPQGMCFYIPQANFGYFLSLKMYLLITLLWELLTKLSYIAVHLVSGFIPTSLSV